MIPTSIQTSFTRIGARVKTQPTFGWRAVSNVSIDIASDSKGQYFNLLLPPDAQLADLAVDVIDVRPEMRHLLLLVRQDGRKDKFLCGHDERHWFTCAVPGQSVANVRGAMEALKPEVVRRAQHRAGLRARQQLRRKNAAFMRQGEWFFLPAPHLVVPEHFVLRQEPISRGRGKPHRVQEAYREGGESVYVCRRHPAGLTPDKYQALLARDPQAKGWNWTRMVRNPAVYARGRVSHVDHATITLHGWHQVLMNTEHEAPAARNVVFLD